MRRAVITVAACAIGVFALSATAEAASDPTGAGALHGSARATKAPKPKVYEWCGTGSGCGFETDLWSKTKTFGFFGSPVGTYTTGKKSTLTLFDENTGCTVFLKKLPKTKNYSGSEPGSEGCLEQDVTLTFLHS